MRTAVTIVFLASFGFATLVNYVISPSITRDNPIGFDGHIELANNLAHGNGFVFEPGGHKVFHRPPLAAFVLAPGTLLPQKLWRLYTAALNAALLAATGGIILAVGRPIFGAAANLAWFFLSFHPIILMRIKTAHSCMLQMFLYTTVLAMSWQLWRDWRSGRPLSLLRGFAYGVVLLGATLVHGTMLVHAAFFLGFFGVCALATRNGPLFRLTLASTLAFCLLLAPWTWRNYRATGAFIPVAGNMGLAYFAGNAQWGITQAGQQAGETRDQAEMRHIGFPREPDSQRTQFYGFKNFEDEKFANAQATHHLKTHPADFLKKLGLNTLDYYWPVFNYLTPAPGSKVASDPFMVRMKTRNALLLLAISLFNLVVVGLALKGALCLLARRETLRLGIVALVAWGAFMAPYLPFLTAGNHQVYTFGTIPILALLAAIGLLRPPITLSSPRTIPADSARP